MTKLEAAAQAMAEWYRESEAHYRSEKRIDEQMAHLRREAEAMEERAVRGGK